MFETQKIDSFFNVDKNLLDEEEKIFMSRRMKVVRFFKLFLPCLVALLLGLGVVLFDFDNAADTSLGLADEEKLYFEKFRMKNTVFEIIDRDGKFSVLKADIVEEMVPGKKVYDLVRPDAQTLDKGKIITLTAQTGAYNQNKQELTLKTNVIANYNKQMEIKTNSGAYNFAKEYGFGNEKVIGNGEKGSFEADKFTFDKKKNIITLIGNVFMKSGDNELHSPDKAILFMDDNKFVSTTATITKQRDILKGDVVTAFFKDMKQFELLNAYSSGHTELHSDGKKAFSDEGEYDATAQQLKLIGNVKIVDRSGYVATAKNGIYDLVQKTFILENDVKITKETNVITAPKAIYFETTDELRFYGGVKVKQDSGTATADNGVYYIKKNIAELDNNVVITKDGNSVRGDKAISDFNTSQSRLIAKNGGRISGKLNEASFKSKKGK
ncbi:MAG: LPS export ABC transporter periplasmic protein LptC [Acetobacter sp.]|nr:LPS export ABC transporter periplasmic protein LptC [Acetobacter sp.]